ncbi:MAG: hypothetical protein PHZ19_10520 [Candidatus Thermoplasmatota archaeon]|nr:hypothetical protein [Candidatus Thermoplasmatota archaeon]
MKDSTVYDEGAMLTCRYCGEPLDLGDDSWNELCQECLAELEEAERRRSREVL